MGRFRVNAFHQRGTVSIVFRHIKSRPPTFEDLKLDPGPLVHLAKSKDGILLVCGATGSGKSSTMAAMINWINQHKPLHIVTLENPIEFLHRDKQSSVTQREVGVDTESFAIGLRAALRQDPDVVMIGEMRDVETISTERAR